MDMIKDGKNYYISTNVQGGKVIDAEDGSGPAIWDLNNGPRQRWKARQMANPDEWAFQSAEYGTYIAAQGEDEPLQLSALDPSVNEPLRWKVKGRESMKEIDSVAYPGPPQEVADLSEKDPTNGTPIILYPSNAGSNQRWGFAPV